jgi:nucleotide-binding universal stress UspA family protein
MPDVSATAANHGTHQPGRSVVVGHDGHPSSAAALQTATDLARALDAHLHVVHSVTLEDYGVDPDADDFEGECAANLTQERSRVEATLKAADVSWTYHEERGDPAACLTILATRHDASLIVIGAGHHGMFRHALAGGSVAQHLLHEQGRPVVVVPVAP